MSSSSSSKQQQIVIDTSLRKVDSVAHQSNVFYASQPIPIVKKTKYNTPPLSPNSSTPAAANSTNGKPVSSSVATPTDSVTITALQQKHRNNNPPPIIIDRSPGSVQKTSFFTSSLPNNVNALSNIHAHRGQPSPSSSPPSPYPFFGSNSSPLSQHQQNIPPPLASSYNPISTLQQQHQPNPKFKTPSKYQCNVCGKIYKNDLPLKKHLWEHSEYYNKLPNTTYNTKHQKVQVLEAASILTSFGGGSSLSSSITSASSPAGAYFPQNQSAQQTTTTTNNRDGSPSQFDENFDEMIIDVESLDNQTEALNVLVDAIDLDFEGF